MDEPRHLNRSLRDYAYVTGWRSLIGCLKLQVIFRKRATSYRALLREMTKEDKPFYDFTPPCRAVHCAIMHVRAIHCARSHANIVTNCNTPYHTAQHCTTLQHTAPHCTALHHTATRTGSAMGWLRSVGLIKSKVSFAEYRLFYRALLQRRPIIESILPTEATPYISDVDGHVVNMHECTYGTHAHVRHGRHTCGLTHSFRSRSHSH